MMTKVLVLYYPAYGHIETMAGGRGLRCPPELARSRVQPRTEPRKVTLVEVRKYEQEIA